MAAFALCRLLAWSEISTFLNRWLNETGKCDGVGEFASLSKDIYDEKRRKTLSEYAVFSGHGFEQLHAAKYLRSVRAGRRFMFIRRRKPALKPPVSRLLVMPRVTRCMPAPGVLNRSTIAIGGITVKLALMRC